MTVSNKRLIAAERIDYPKSLPWFLGALLLLAVGIGIGWWYQSYPELRAVTFDENGPVETLETIALAFAIGAFNFRAVRTDDPIGTMCIPIALVLAVALIRETPRCDSRLYDGGLCFPTQLWKDYAAGLFVACAAIALFIRRRHFRSVFSIRRIHVFWPIWISALFLVVAELSETYKVLGTEESLEFFAYLYLAAFGIWIHRNT